MSSNLITQPYGIILDPTGGGGRAKPVANGRYHVGIIDLDPVANPRTDLAYKDESGTEYPLTSPLILNNSGAFVVSENDGTLIQPYMKDGVGHSVLITDKRGTPVYSDNHVGDPGNIDEVLQEKLPKYTDIVYESVADMVVGVPVLLSVGERGSTGGTLWERVSESSPPVIGDFSPLNTIELLDFNIAELTDISAELRMALDLGPVTISGSGSYKLNAFEFKSNDVFLSDNFKVTLSSDSGIVVAFGSIDALSFTSPNVSYKTAGSTLTQGESELTLDNPADANNFTVGDLVCVWSEEGYTDGLSSFKPKFQQLTKVTGISSGVISVADPFYKDQSATEIRITKSGEFANQEGVDNGLTENVKFKGFKVYSPNDSWSRFGGTYNSDFEVEVVGSDGAFVNNGFTNSKGFVKGNVRRRCVDLAYFSSGSEVKLGAINNTSDISDPLFSFAEGAHGNSIINTLSNIKNQASAISAIVQFIPGSYGNKLTGGEIIAPTCTYMVNINNQESGLSVMDFDNNLLDDITIRTPSCQNMIRSNSLSDSGITGVKIGAGVTLESIAVSSDMVDIQSSGVNIVGATLSTEEARRVYVSSGVKSGSLKSCNFKVRPSLIEKNKTPFNISNNQYENDASHIADYNFASGASSNNIDPTLYFADVTIPAGGAIDDDLYMIEAWFTVTGISDQKNLAIRINDTNYAGQTIAQGDEGNFHLKSVLSVTAPSSQRVYTDINGKIERSGTGFDINSVPLQFGIAFWLNNSSDSFVLESVSVRTFRNG